MSKVKRSCQLQVGSQKYHFHELNRAISWYLLSRTRRRSDLQFPKQLRNKELICLYYFPLVFLTGILFKRFETFLEWKKSLINSSYNAQMRAWKLFLSFSFLLYQQWYVVASFLWQMYCRFGQKHLLNSLNVSVNVEWFTEKMQENYFTKIKVILLEQTRCSRPFV